MSSRLVWLITGCSSGFGEQFTLEALARGDKVVATARRLDRIAHLRASGASVLQLDVTESEDDLKSTVERAIQIHGRIDVLVNNAAHVTMGVWEVLTYEALRGSFETNVFGVVKLTKAVLPHMRERRSGTIVFISSLSGWIGHPGCGAYAGSKFALEGLVESLSAEVTQFNIKTLLVEPGRFRTKLLSPTNMHDAALTTTIPDYEAFSTAFSKNIRNEDGRQPGDPTKLSRVVLDMVRDEGIAVERTAVEQSKPIPFRLPLGNDVYTDIKSKCEETLALLESWKDVIRGTDIKEDT